MKPGSWRIFFVTQYINNCLKPINRKKGTNLTFEERKTLASLKDKNLNFLPSDKGGEFCVINQEQYTSLGMSHLNDNDTYKQVKAISAKCIETRINKVWKDIATRRGISHHITKSFVSNNTDLPHFYFLIKTHKQSEVPKIRPIVSNINSPSTKISWLLDKILKPLLKFVPAHLLNTSHLVNNLCTLSKPFTKEFNYPCSLDVVSLYTSVPAQSATENVMRLLESNDVSFNNLDHSDIGKLLEITLTNNYFTFNNNTFQQTHGISMGNCVSAILAILYMGWVEEKALDIVSNHVGFYARYVDDVCLLARNQNEANLIHSAFNTVDPNIKFEIEHPNDTNTLQLLDIESSH